MKTIYAIPSRRPLPILWLVIALAALPSWAAPIDEAPFQELKSYDLQKRNTGHAIRKTLGQSPNDGKLLSEIESRLIAVLAAPESTFAAKQEVSRLLRLVGTARSAPAFASLLTDDKLSDVARFALERNPDPAAAKALRDALKVANGRALIGIINSLGNRGDAAAVAALKPFLSQTNAEIAGATVAALGKIGTREAVTLLQAQSKKDAAWSQAMIAGATRLASSPKTKDESIGIYRELLADKSQPVAARLAAAHSLLTGVPSQTMPLLLQLLSGGDTDLQSLAARFVREMAGGSDLLPLLSNLEKLPIRGQVLLIGALGDRGDKVLLPGLMRAAATPNPEVRLAALRALATMPGNAEATLMLAKTAARTGESSEKEAARSSLATIRGAAVDEAIVAAIPTAEPDILSVLALSIGQRANSSARPLLFRLADSSDAGVQSAAMNSLGELARTDDYGALVRLLLNTKSDAVRNAAESLVLRVSRQVPTEAERTGSLIAAIPIAPLETKASVLKVLGAMGGPLALGAVRAELKSSDPKVQDLAIRALANAPDAEAMPDLLEIAGTSANPVHRVLALRGYLRLVDAAVSRQGDKPDLNPYEQALKVATGADDKKSVIAGLARVNSVGALALLTPLLDDEAVRNEASLAVIGIARNIREKNPTEAKDALDKVVALSKDENALKQAGEILKSIPVR